MDQLKIADSDPRTVVVVNIHGFISNFNLSHLQLTRWSKSQSDHGSINPSQQKALGKEHHRDGQENVPFTVSMHASSHPELDTQEIRHRTCFYLQTPKTFAIKFPFQTTLALAI
jgi:hypothetical protein